MDQKFEELDKRITKIETDTKANAANIVINTNQCGDVARVSSQNRSDIIDLRAEIGQLTESNSDLVTQVTDLNLAVAKQAIRNQVLEVCSEDLANRSLRKTICIRGIPEDNEEVSWDVTRDVACTALQSATKIEYDEIDGMIERIHRGSKNPHGTRNLPRKIFCTVHNWNSIDNLITELRSHGKTSGIYIDRQYGPDTTYRQNLAHFKRKQLKEAKTISSGYVKYPAQLYVKYGQSLQYVLCEDFSKVTIPDEEYARRMKFKTKRDASN